MVVADMTLAVFSIFANIIVITAIKEKEELLNDTFNLVLLNLCFANLMRYQNSAFHFHNYLNTDSTVAALLLSSQYLSCTTDTWWPSQSYRR